MGCYVNEFGLTVCENSAWSDTGRWVLIGVLVGFFVLMIVGFIAFSCISSRRRAKTGQKPLRGTAWAMPPAYSAQDPYPEAKELAESPAPSYGEATSSNASRENQRNSPAPPSGEPDSATQDGYHLRTPEQVADPEAQREHV